MRKLLALVAVALVGAGFHSGHARAAVPFGCGTTPLASLNFPESRICQETQGWWLDKAQTGGVVPALPPANAPLISSHDHLMIPFPMGEQVVIPASGGYSWSYFAQYHNMQGGTIRQVRGGQWQLGPCCTKDPAVSNRAITAQDQTLSGSIPIPSNEVTTWRGTTGKKENRFTSDTTSPFGKRLYQSGAWNAFLNAAGAPVGFTARGWYETTGYTNFTLKDSNIGVGTGFRASQLSATCAPSSVSLPYSLAEGATHAFLYIDPNLHAGSKGTVIAENRTGSSGTFTFSTVGLAPGTHVALGGAWEKATDGWNAGVARLPFRVC